ncbi:MAG: haloacid dehalogenase [Methylothermaceae bacteria B42]|nr:MAG: haloacid dehalogenase [Methylothermaceae bacteria B42]HHJ38268.1 acireductone synthase [Methylothermaceae bacterium]
MTRAIVTDIEGTTSSLSFVKDVLFPYARERLSGFVAKNQDDPKVKPLLEEVRQLVGREMTVPQVITQLLHWSDADKKIAPLKAIQGMIWEEGYQKGDFEGHVYPDAVEQLGLWREQGIQLYVYSSGSVAAQKLLFSHTEWGDLTPIFSGFFDTRTGSKKDSSSYTKIAHTIGFPAREILFLSDIKEELEAAAQAGMEVYWLVREGELDPNAPFRQVRDFSQIEV